MRNIILQHWSGPMIELTELSSANISKYAAKIGADYRLLLGDVFRPGLTAPCQKVHMIEEEFDDYDMVVMVDADMFTRVGMTDDVFMDPTGIGRHTAIQDSLVVSLQKRFPKLGNPKFPYWGGSIYRLDKNIRKQLRQHLHDDEMKQFSGNFEDEGIMHRLAVLSQMKITDDTYLPGNLWNRGSFEEGVESAALIHIRTKIAPGGPKKPKIVNYRNLVKQGIIEE